MGRGRAKAKRQKVARELKYGGPDTDLDRLAAELSAERALHPHSDFPEDEADEDKYADWIDEDAADDDEVVDADDQDRR